MPGGELGYVDTNGYRRIADTRDEMELVALLGVADPLPSHVVHAVKKGDWVLDVGANVGNTTAPLCHLVGRMGMVWAVEPMPRNIQRLRELRDLNHLDQMTIYEGALSSTNGDAILRLPSPGHSGWASFIKDWDFVSTLQVRTWRLDDLVAAATTRRRLAFVKIDVEGFEIEVLKGATATLRSHRPTILCEFNNILLQAAGHSSQDLLDVFAELGYQPRPQRVRKRFSNAVEDLLLFPQQGPSVRPD